MTVHDSAYVEFVHGSSAKFYRLRHAEDAGVHRVTAQWGRIGTDGQSGDKYAGADAGAARAAFNRALAEKLGKGYVSATDPQATAQPAAAPAVTSVSIVEPATGDGVPVFPAQLAGQSGDIAAALAEPGEYVFEEKWDGHRALVALLPGGRIEIRNRHGQNKGRVANTPAIEAQLRALAAQSPELWAGTLIDGELVADTFAQTAHLLGSAGQTEGGLRLMAFDLPYLAGTDLRDRPWTERRAALEKTLAPITALVAQPLVVVTEAVAPHAGYVEEIWQRGGEGIIIKRRDAAYFPGGRFHWSKVKREQTADGVVTGFIPGQGKYSGMVGAVCLSQYRDGELVEVAAVSGMTDEVRRQLDPSWLGRVVEFEYQERTADRYRHPRWVRVRDDKAAVECEW
jgi:ATP-dependent DNA ligase